MLTALLRGEPEPVRRLMALPRTQVLLPQPVVGEVLCGLARLPRSKRRTALTNRCQALLTAMLRAEWTDMVSKMFGETKASLERKSTRLDDFDIAIAAHALALDAVLVTRNVQHMARISGLRMEHWE
ncbi:MAG: type II toxin-antitoxin system VapC family toxin [Polyangiaceae bacterium]|nr:type II toxin-antitoxin system VapC family toxin [Polyangiaceae bacterium]